MFLDLLSFLRKIPNDNSVYVLEWQGLKINKKYSELKSRFPDFNHSTLLSLSILLQNLLLSPFTDNEIKALSSLSLNLLSVTNCPVSNKKTLNSKQSLFDTNSSRIYEFINFQEISNISKFQMTANFLDFSNSSLYEIIIKLYTGTF